ncbi:electron transport complex subunit RsxC [uncultured Paraglaciecola sp.]|uniref:electron transport complex subunit RsxC n=1 Tax=uncultured Paraglaciecola sp. TaxID=1765024 RepID=UPI0030DC7015|tara:strand:- start:27252 stop:29945 length:2694 start_codon:yes stop_codon:yes gene_type:complete
MNRVLIPSFDEIVKHVERNKLWDFPGGVFPAQQKELSNHQPIESMTLPERLYIPLKQHIGVEGQLLVGPGEYVLKGQPLTRSANPFAVPVHASTSGTVISVGPHVSAHPSALPEQTLVIEPDTLDKWIALTPLKDYQSLPKVAVLEAICNAGVSGMGGAGFPTHIKASPKKDVEFIIINGVECEPYITADDRLMREHAWQIRQGIDVLCHLLSPKQVYIAIEDNKPEAIEAMRVACQQSEQYKVVPIATKYPAGGEKQLIQVLTNREVPKQGLPIDVGVIMHNVGTCYAIADAVFSGKPLIHRVVTVTGKAVSTPKNVWALIGAPVAHLLASAGYLADKQSQKQIIMGGPMMGFTLASDQVPVVKITNCLLLPTQDEIAEPEAEQPCIRCSACADACPVSLLPQQLFWHSKAKELDKAQDYNLFDCIECGACAYVCPSDIPLVHYYRVTKAEIRLEQEEKQKSDKARERFESRAARLVREQEARDEKHRKAAEARQSAMQNKGNDAGDKIAAALARAKAKKAQQAEYNANEPTSIAPSVQTNQDTPIQSSGTSKDDRVAAAIARAKAKKAQKINNNETNTDSVAINDTPISVSANEALVETQIEPSETAGNSKDSRVAAAIARAKEKKAQRLAQAESAPLEPKIDQDQITPSAAPKESSAPGESKDERVAAAIARAKAKNTEKLATEKPVEPQITGDEKPVAVQQILVTPQLNPEINSTSQSQTNDSLQIEVSAKNQRIAAVVAKAKAKKVQQVEQDKVQAEVSSYDFPDTLTLTESKIEEPVKNVSKTPVPDDEALTEQLDPADQKKARIAAAVAKAKAKKLAKEAASDVLPNKGEVQKNNEVPAPLPDQSVTSTINQETQLSEAEEALDEKKRRIAIAVAKAKAKKAAQLKSSED